MGTPNVGSSDHQTPLLMNKFTEVKVLPETRLSGSVNYPEERPNEMLSTPSKVDQAASHATAVNRVVPSSRIDVPGNSIIQPRPDTRIGIPTLVVMPGDNLSARRFHGAEQLSSTTRRHQGVRIQEKKEVCIRGNRIIQHSLASAVVRKSVVRTRDHYLAQSSKLHRSTQVPWQRRNDITNSGYP
jgi:hypothetical protein